MKPYEESLAGLTEHANALRLATIDEEDWALVANHLRVIEVDLGKKRREIEADATAVAQEARKAEPYGKKVEYESERGSLVEQTKRVYSFNTPGLLSALLEQGDWTLTQAIRAFQEANALSLVWKISFLENVADRYGLHLVKADHEIEDGDAEYLVGVVTTTKMVRG
jgi:hypothetical protein